MSVLTVSGSAALPDRSLPVRYPAETTFAARSTVVPLRADTIEGYSYTRSAAANSQPGLPHSHRHSRTISSAVLPVETYSSDPSSATNQPVLPLPGYKSLGHSRQSSTGTSNMQRQPTSASANSAPRRSTSSRSTSTNSPTSYVALMRKQKATVWCDRSQNLDPRMAQAQRAAKHRAALEVTGAGLNSNRTSTISSTGVVGKIRHGGVPKAPGYSPANMSGAGVPLRLSANEMLGDEEDHRSYGDNGMIHGRSGSGKSSTGSAKYRSGYPRPDQGRFSGINTPPSGEISPGKEGIPELNESEQEKAEHTGTMKRHSEESFGGIGDLRAPNSLHQAVSDAKKAEDLKRRGSVDERAMSMGTGVRLYVANPDLDDD